MRLPCVEFLAHSFDRDIASGAVIAWSGSGTPPRPSVNVCYGPRSWRVAYRAPAGDMLPIGEMAFV